MTSLTVLSYNIRSLRDDPQALARVIRAIAPDVALLQEAPRFLRWRSECAALARRVGMVGVCGGRAAGANLVFSSLALRVLATRDVAFSKQPNLHHRGAALALLELAGSQFAIAGTHLDLIEAPRLKHLDELAVAISEVVPADVPVIVGGDFNALPGSATWLRLQRIGPDAHAAVGQGEGFTYSAAAPVRRIDALFADERLVPLRADALDSPDIRVASDHRPLVVEYQLAAL